MTPEAAPKGVLEQYLALVERASPEAEWDGVGFPLDWIGGRYRARAQLTAVNANVTAALLEYADKIANGEAAYLACPGPPNCGGSGAHYPTCPVELATQAVATVGAELEKVEA